jgi:hypothetical protein
VRAARVERAFTVWKTAVLPLDDASTKMVDSAGHDPAAFRVQTGRSPKMSYLPTDETVLGIRAGLVVE